MTTIEMKKFLKKIKVGDEVEITYRQEGRVENPKTVIGQIYSASPLFVHVAYPDVDVFKNQVDVSLQTYKISPRSIINWKIKKIKNAKTRKERNAKSDCMS